MVGNFALPFVFGVAYCPTELGTADSEKIAEFRRGGVTVKIVKGTIAGVDERK